MRSPAHASGDGWVQCRCGAQHWGRFGAAGLLLSDGAGSVVLQHRAQWSHHGGTWGIPGGAAGADETAVQAALRESAEEAGLAPGDLRLHATSTLEHPDWSYTTVLATDPSKPAVRATDAESVAVQWHHLDELTGLTLLAPFAEALPVLQGMLATHPTLIIDAANVVGSRPDGWWKDRAGATTRLGAQIGELADLGVPASLLDLPGSTWWPKVLLVTEGRANAAPDTPGVRTVRSPASGDDQIVELVDRAAQDAGKSTNTEHYPITVVTSDRGLRARLDAPGVRCIWASTLRKTLDTLTGRA